MQIEILAICKEMFNYAEFCQKLRTFKNVLFLNNSIDSGVKE